VRRPSTAALRCGCLLVIKIRIWQGHSRVVKCKCALQGKALSSYGFTCKWVRSTNQAGYTLHTHKISLSALLEIKALQVLVTEESITTVLLCLWFGWCTKPQQAVQDGMSDAVQKRGGACFLDLSMQAVCLRPGAACSPLVCWTVQLVARARCEEMQETH
jgi:hypothetical protein